MSESQVLSPSNTHKDNCFHVAECLAGSSDAGRITGAVQRKGWAGEESWQEEIPQKKLGNNTNGRVTKPCSAADSDNQAAAFSSRPAKPRGRGDRGRKEQLCLLNQTSEQALSRSCMQPEPVPYELRAARC